MKHTFFGKHLLGMLAAFVLLFATNLAARDGAPIGRRGTPPCPVITFTATPANTCPGSNSGQIVVSNVSGGAEPYTYSKDNGVTYQPGSIFSGLAAGNYQVWVKDNNGCTAAQSVNVGTFSAPSCAIESDFTDFFGDYITCNNTSGLFFTGPAGMNSYNWSISGGGSIPGPVTGSSVLVTSGNFGTDYTLSLTVEDGNGCSSTCGVQSYNIFQKPPANITVLPGNSVCFGVTLDLSISAEASSTVVWTGDGITNPNGNPSTTANPSTTGLQTYSVMVTTSDYYGGCTNTGSVEVDVNAIPATPTCPSYAATCVTAPPIVLSGASPGGGTYSGPGVSSGTFNPSTAGVGAHTITYTVTDEGCSSSCTFSIVVGPSCGTSFSGRIKFSNNNSLGVNNANVVLAGAGSGSDMTDSNGDFSINLGAGSGDFTLTPAKTANKLNGVSVADVTAIQQHVANSVPIIDPYKLVAADVNKSNSVNSLDASVINQALLGNPSALAQIKTSWRFVPTSHTMSSPPWGFPEKRSYTGISGPQTGQDFYGIKTGDVATNFANPANFGAGTPLVLRSTDRLLQAGETFQVSFQAAQNDDLAALQCAFRFDPEFLQLADIQPQSALPLSLDNFGTYQAGEGEIRLIWSQSSSVALSEAAPVFDLVFTALQGGVKLGEVLQLDESELPALSYTAALAQSKVKLEFAQLSSTGNPSDAGSVQLLQNRPNPFNGATLIGFILPEPCEVQLRVFDVSGRLLAERSGTFAAGRNDVSIDLTGASGVLYYELTTPYGNATRKMLALK